MPIPILETLLDTVGKIGWLVSRGFLAGLLALHASNGLPTESVRQARTDIAGA